MTAAQTNNLQDPCVLRIPITGAYLIKGTSIISSYELSTGDILALKKYAALQFPFWFSALRNRKSNASEQSIASKQNFQAEVHRSNRLGSVQSSTAFPLHVYSFIFDNASHGHAAYHLPGAERFACLHWSMGA
jgi:hypothetical protein